MQPNHRLSLIGTRRLMTYPMSSLRSGPGYWVRDVPVFDWRGMLETRLMTAPPPFQATSLTWHKLPEACLCP